MRNYKDINDSPLINTLLRTFLNNVDSSYEYTFYVGCDDKNDIAEALKELDFDDIVLFSPGDVRKIINHLNLAVTKSHRLPF